MKETVVLHMSLMLIQFGKNNHCFGMNQETILPFLSKLARYEKVDCLKVVDFGNEWKDPILRTDFRYLNNSKTVSEFLPFVPCHCVAVISNRLIPVEVMLNLIEWKNRMKKEIYFFSSSEWKEDAKRFLLDPAFILEPNLVVVALETKEILVRQLFNDQGVPRILVKGNWTDEGKLEEIQSKQIFPNQFRNLHGTSLRGSSLKFEPFISYTTNSDLRDEIPVIPQFSCEFVLLEEIGKHLNFKWNIIRPTDGIWSLFHPSNVS